MQLNSVTPKQGIRRNFNTMDVNFFQIFNARMAHLLLSSLCHLLKMPREICNVFPMSFGAIFYWRKHQFAVVLVEITNA